MGRLLALHRRFVYCASSPAVPGERVMHVPALGVRGTARPVLEGEHDAHFDVSVLVCVPHFPLEHAHGEGCLSVVVRDHRRDLSEQEG